MKIPGTLSHVREGVWRYRLFLKSHDVTGKLVTKRPSRVFHVRTEHEATLEAMKFLQESGITTGTDSIQAKTLGDAVTLWVHEEETAPRRKGAHNESRKRVEAFSQWLGGSEQLEDVSALHVTRYWKWRMATHGIKATTAQRELSALSGFFRFCQESEMIKRNPVRDCVRPKCEVNYDVPVCSIQEIDVILKSVEGHPTFYPFYLLNWFQAWRKKTVLEARWEHIEPAANDRLFMKVWAKGRTRRFVLSNKVTKWLRENWQDSGPIVVGEKGDAMSAKGWDAVHRNENDRRSRSKVPALPCSHACRRGWATDAALRGVSIENIRVALGHKDQKQTAAYLHLDEGMFAEALLDY